MSASAHAVLQVAYATAARIGAATKADAPWQPPAWLTALGSVVVVLLGSSAVAAAFGAVRSGAAARGREYTAAARALTAWAEYPYRVRRRTSDSPETLAALAKRAHDLQEQLADHQAWCATEHPAMGALYAYLRAELAASINGAIATAWASPPITSATQMTLGGSFPVDTRGKEMLACLNACMRERMGWRRLQPARSLSRRLAAHVRDAGFHELPAP